MLVGLLLFGHCALYLISMTIRITIYRYIKKKVPGLQSVLDLLMLDLIRVQTFSNTYLVTMLLTGYFYGQLPNVLAQIMICLSINSAVFMFGMYQFFITMKAILVFKGSWIADVSDQTILHTSRLFASLWTSVRFFGDFMVPRNRPEALTKFLTGSNQET